MNFEVIIFRVKEVWKHLSRGEKFIAVVGASSIVTTAILGYSALVAVVTNL